jgi:hypothetical protein
LDRVLLVLVVPAVLRDEEDPDDQQQYADAGSAHDQPLLALAGGGFAAADGLPLGAAMREFALTLATSHRVFLLVELQSGRGGV